MIAATLDRSRYMTREHIPTRRHSWRQKVVIADANDGGRHKFYVDFGEYADGRLGEVFITAHKHGTFARGTLDALARMISLALQSGTSPVEVAKSLMGLSYPPFGEVVAEGSTVEGCTSIADYLAREISACYGEDGRRLTSLPVEDKVAGYKAEGWRTGI